MANHLTSKTVALPLRERAAPNFQRKEMGSGATSFARYAQPLTRLAALATLSRKGRG